MEPNPVAVQLFIQNLSVREQIAALVASAQGFRVLADKDPGVADLVIFEVGTDLTREAEYVRSFQNAPQPPEVFLTSPRTDQEILLHAIRVGSKEFFSQPVKEEDVLAALQRFLDRRERAQGQTTRRASIISVIGAKGGVGTTTIAVNLAVALAASRAKAKVQVSLVDLNLTAGEVPLFLDLPQAHHWGDLTGNIARLDTTLLTRAFAAHSSGVQVLAAPVAGSEEHVATPEAFDCLLGLMRTVYDQIVVDAGQPLFDVTMKVLEISDTVLLVVTPSIPCLVAASRTLKTFRDLGYPAEDRVKVIMNRHYENAEISLKEAEESLNRKVFWLLPDDYPATMFAMNRGKSLFDTAKRAPVTKKIARLAEVLTDKGEKKGGFLGMSFFGKS